MHERIRAVRKSLGLNQKSFAEQIGLNQNSLSMIEKNHTPVTEKNVKLICVEFNVNEQWLRSGRGQMFRASPYEKKLRDICVSLTLENQESLLLIAQELLKIQERIDGASSQRKSPNQSPTSDQNPSEPPNHSPAFSAAPSASASSREP